MTKLTFRPGRGGGSAPKTIDLGVAEAFLQHCCSMIVILFSFYSYTDIHCAGGLIIRFRCGRRQLLFGFWQACLQASSK